MAGILSVPILLSVVVSSVLGQYNSYGNQYDQNSYKSPSYGQPYSGAPYGGYSQPQPYMSQPYNSYQQPSYSNYQSQSYGYGGKYGNYSTPGSLILQNGNVIYATGSTGSDESCVPGGTEYYVNFQYDLIRVDPAGAFQHTQVKIASNVKYVYDAYDDSVWYVDMDGVIWRLHYKEAPEKLPGQPQVKFTKVAALNYEIGRAVAENGELWERIAGKWYRRATNTNSVGVGVDGTMLYGDSYQQIYIWNYEQYNWGPYEVQGKTYDIYDADHVVVCDANDSCQKRVNYRWVPIPDKCQALNLLSDSFYCITPTNQVKLVPY